MRVKVLSRRNILAATLSVLGWSSPTLADSTTLNRALIVSAGRGESREVERLLARGASVSARDDAGRTALMAATRGNHPAVARLLIAAGADVNAKDDLQDSPFLYAGAEGLVDILKMTLAAGADLRSVNRYGGTALIPACHHGHVETVRILLATRININLVNNLGWTALLEAVILGDGSAAYVEIVRLLVEAGADVTIADQDGVNALQHAERRNFKDIASLFARVRGK